MSYLINENQKSNEYFDFVSKLTVSNKWKIADSREKLIVGKIKCFMTLSNFTTLLAHKHFWNGKVM